MIFNTVEPAGERGGEEEVGVREEILDADQENEMEDRLRRQADYEHAN